MFFSIKRTYFRLFCVVLCLLLFYLFIRQLGEMTVDDEIGQLGEIEVEISNEYLYTERIRTSNLTGDMLMMEWNTEPLYSESAKCYHEIFLLILVTTRPENVDQRTFVRSSWGRSFEKQIELLTSLKTFHKNETFSVENVVKVIFLVGQSDDNITKLALTKESEYEGDIVIGNFTDSYRNLSMKTRFGFKWAYYACASRFIMKTDDDVWVNPIWITEWLKGVPDEKLYTGRCDENVVPVRNPQDKYYVSHEEFPGKTYPHYCLGPGYILSRDVLSNITIQCGRKLFPMEDIYVGLLVHDLNTTDVRDEKLHFHVYNERGITRYYEQENDCKLQEHFIEHHLSGINMVSLTNRVTKALIQCKMQNESSIYSN